MDKIKALLSKINALVAAYTDARILIDKLNAEIAALKAELAARDAVADEAMAAIDAILDDGGSMGGVKVA